MTQSGELGGSGSSAVTSMPAPAMWSLPSLSTRRRLGVVDDEYADAHAVASVVIMRRTRGSRTVNSVNLPTSLATSIVPPYCWVTTS